VYCRTCELRSHGTAQSEPAHPGRVWGADRISGLRCGRCGALLGAEDIAHLLLQKQSQLQRFGLLRPPTAAEPKLPAPLTWAPRVLKTEKD